MYRFEILKILGKGSFGQVLKCYDHKLGSHIALKIVRNEKRFHRQAQEEIRILEHLKKQDKVQSEGFVIANDTDTKRAYMLTHQAKRLNLPAHFVTCNDARQLPNLKLGKEKYLIRLI